MPDYRLQRFRGAWAFSVYDGGVRVSRRRLDATTAREADAEFEALKADLQRGAVKTVADIWEAYRNDRQGRVIARNMTWSGKAILPFFGSLKANEITTALCRSYLAHRRAKDIGDGTVWTELGHLRIALVWAEEKAGLIEKAPAIERPSQPAPRDRHLSRDEFDVLLDAASLPHIRLFIILAITTGGRNSALLELSWDRVDFERGTVDLRDPESRTGKGRAVVPMNDSLRAALLEAAAGRRTDRVIEWAGEPVTKVRRALAKATTRAGLADVTPHVFRHSAAVWMAEGGESMSEIAQFLGHSDSRITERVYARFSPKHLRKAASHLEIGNLQRKAG